MTERNAIITAASVFLGVDLYVAALTGARPARTREELPEHDADGVIIEPVGAPEDEHSPHASEQTVTAHEPVVVTNAGAVAVEAPAKIIEGLQEALAVAAGDAEPYGWSAEELSPGGEDVASPPAHAPEQPGNDHGSVNPPAEGGAHSAPISQPVSEAPSLASADRSGGHLAPSSSLQAVSAPVTTPADPVEADRTKPHPWCRDPDDCGVHGSWNFMCGECLRLKGQHHEAAE